MRRSSPHIVFAGGVTGGHLFPGLAVAEQLLARDASLRISFAGPGSPFDRLHVHQAGYAYYEIQSPRWPKRIAHAASFGFTALRGFREATQFLSREHVSAVVGLGGFASVSVASAAIRCDIPLVLLEQNAVLGRANRMLARWAARLCLSYAQTERVPPPVLRRAADRMRLTGTPVRAKFGRIAGCLDRISDAEDRFADTASRRQTLLVLGGSGGARQLNLALPAALAPLRDLLADWRVAHQAGVDDVTQTALAYDDVGIKATVAPFFYDLPELMARADLAVCRAGGSTLAELAVAGVPAILIPLATATDGHQHANAREFVRRGAARIIASGDAAPTGHFAGRLSREVAAVLKNPVARELMAAKMRQAARPRAAQDIAEVLLELASATHRPKHHLQPSRPKRPASIDVPAPHFIRSRTARTPPP